MGRVMAVCTSEKKGTRKQNIKSCELVEDFGLKDDAHAGKWHRQVSLLAYEKIEDFKKRGADVVDGDFGENIIVAGIDLVALPIGTLLEAGEIILEVTQIGKKCHTHCEIYHRMGECIMPKQGIFAKVLKGGKLEGGQEINVRKQ